MTAVQFNPFTPEAQADPYPLYRSLREADPVHHSELMDLWVLTRHEDVSFVLKDDRFSADRRKSTNLLVTQARKMQEEGPFAQANTMLSADPPEHTRLRGLVSKAFTPRRIEEMRPHIQEIVDALLDDLQDRDEFDLIEHLSYPLPVIVIAEMLGIPPENGAEFKPGAANHTGPDHSDRQINDRHRTVTRTRRRPIAGVQSSVVVMNHPLA